MTEKHLCDVCHVRESLGVACTIIPYSCFYCAECARRNAQPEVVFLTIYDDVGKDFEKMAPGLADSLVTYFDDRYMSYKEWASHQK